MGEYGNKVMGKTKKAFGRATGDRDLEDEGRMQGGVGKVQGGVRKAGRAVNRGIDKVARKAGRPARRPARRASTPRAARPARVRRSTMAGRYLGFRPVVAVSGRR